MWKVELHQVKFSNKFSVWDTWKIICTWLHSPWLTFEIQILSWWLLYARRKVPGVARLGLVVGNQEVTASF
jgi:hypothetical protein